MSGKRISKDLDLAAGFFTTVPEEREEKIEPERAFDFEKVNIIQKKSKHPGGRPRKEGLKNEQFSVTLNPEMYEKIKIIANDRNGGNFSRLIIEAIELFCRENNIDISQIEVDPMIMDQYMEKQNRKAKK